MGTLRRFNVAELRACTGVAELIETGAGQGDSIAWARSAGMPRCRSVEIHEELAPYCQQRFAGDPAVSVGFGDSREFLKDLPESSLPRLYYLDAHFAGGADFGFTDYVGSGAQESSYPLLAELDALMPKLRAEDLLIIDDARMYFDGSFQNGECPAFARRWHEREVLVQRLNMQASTHQQILLLCDEGYLVLVPNRHSGVVLTWLNILPFDRTPPPALFDGVPGVTSISIQRRLADSRFATRYFAGCGLDVGGGQDSLACYAELFPLIRNIFVYDAAHGDAQTLRNIPESSFDFLYSSHCLEHLRDPHEALGNWIRVVKPGGHLIINIPDEDLYEQGKWPSRYNSDHKLTFTLFKLRSWSPVSVNVMELVARVADRASPLALHLIDQGYRFSLRNQNVDQTRTPIAESAIEIILRKRT
jgi:methyltransferase family protein